MNAPTQRQEPADKTARRRRKQPQRRVPAIIEQRERKPFIFGWGTHLSSKERELLKEKIALFVGVGLAVVLLSVIGWGWYQDNVVAPAARDAANNKPVAQVGTYTVTTGYFKAFESFRNAQLNTELTNIQQQMVGLTTKKNASQLSQLQALQAQVQTQQSSLPADSLTGIIADQTVLQRAHLLRVTVTPAQLAAQVKKSEAAYGGHTSLLRFLAPTGLTYDQFSEVTKAQYLGGKLATLLGKTVPHTQLKVRASHILISATTNALAAKKKPLAEQVYQQVLHGANFKSLAAKYSGDTSNAKKGGDLGYFARGVMTPPFEKAAFSMKIGEVRLVRTTFGWHILKVTGRQNARLSSTDYQTAQQGALTKWLDQQEAIIGVTRYLKPAALPGVATTPTPIGL